MLAVLEFTNDRIKQCNILSLSWTVPYGTGVNTRSSAHPRD
ncbi:hypothetical protein AKO63_3411 [Escherichia coli]|nr:hypothetical protein AKO63_3411 [Escherichia coli]